METATRRRTRWAILVASVVAHVALAIVVMQQRPTLTIPVGDAGPPQAIIPILIMPKAPPAEPGATTPPAAIRLHRRKQRFALGEPTPAPVVIASAPKAAPPAAPPATTRPAPLPEGPKAEVRAALRQGLLGCANRLAVSLSPAERDLCDERLGRGAKDAPFIDPGAGLSREKRALLDRAAAGKSAAKAAAESPLGSGLSGPFVKPSDYDGEPHITGAGASALGQIGYPPSKRGATKLGPLPP